MWRSLRKVAVVALLWAPLAIAFSPRGALDRRLALAVAERAARRTALRSQPISSPFEPALQDDDDDDDEDDVAEAKGLPEDLPLTLENVELILDELRPYLISDGGNVSVESIDGPIVRLQLEGACGTCPSSTMTMKMGLERRLKEAIPEISEVVQALPDAPALTEAALEEVLDGVRPFLSVAGGEVKLAELSGIGSAQPRVELELTGSSASLYSVKQEISQRIHRYFMLAGLTVEWAQ